MAFKSEKNNEIRKKSAENGEIAAESRESVLGRLAFSGAGRDRGGCFIAVGVYDEKYILLADGNRRRIEKPKKKKLRHVTLTKTVFPVIKEKLIAGKPVLNAELRKAVSEFNAAAR